MKRILALVLLIIPIQLTAKVLIITHSYNRPDFIEIQHKTFQNFLDEDYEFVVYNDARDPKIEKEINKTCKRHGIRCIRIPQEIHTSHTFLPRTDTGVDNANTRCADVVQYSLRDIGFKHHGIVVIMDSDLFLIKKFSFSKAMENFDLAGLAQERDPGHIRYIWNGIVFFNMDTLPDKETINFNCGKINGAPVDVGGCVYYYLQDHPQLRIRWIEHTKPDPEVIARYRLNNNIEFFWDNTFFHYRGGTNWDGKSAAYHAQKTYYLNEFINHAMRAQG